jgi:SAM-dependent methyltransferase
VRWIAKAALQKAISTLPEPDRWNYVLQRRVTKALPRPDAHVRDKIGTAVEHLTALAAADASLVLARSHFYEFGAGWDLIIPLVFSAAGVERQTLVDIRPNVRLELVNHVLARLGRLLRESDVAVERPIDPQPVADAAELEPRFGIRYLAPRDARDSGLADGDVDVVTSSVTFEHIPAAHVASILAECARILRPGGLLSCTIDLEDHYSWFDRSISPYNYLRFSDRTWALVNSDVHYQNRLRQSDYVELAAAAGLEVGTVTPYPVSPEDLASLDGVALAPRFRSYDRDDLAIRGTHLVLRKPALA